jgi:hypothetical protein
MTREKLGFAYTFEQLKEDDMKTRILLKALFTAGMLLAFTLNAYGIVLQLG